MSKITPIYTIYESAQNEDGWWSNGRAISVTCFSSKRKAEKSLHAHYESMVTHKDGENITFYEKSKLNAPYFEFTRNGRCYRRWIAQHLLV